MQTMLIVKNMVNLKTLELGLKIVKFTCSVSYGNNDLTQWLKCNISICLLFIPFFLIVTSKLIEILFCQR